MGKTILLVDDHPVFRQGLRRILEKEKNLEVAGEAGDGLEAIERFRDLAPDIVVMDITMPNVDGIEATRRILSEFPEAKVVALSVHSSKRFVSGMLQAGVAGYILKESVPEEMIQGIRAVLAGEIFLSASISGVVVSEYKKLLTDAGQPLEIPGEPILHTKLHRPPISADIIPRARLIEALENGIQKTMTLISAPAGYGKSILASQWLDISRAPGIWVSLDESDNDASAFLRYVLEAIQSLFPQQVLKTRSLLEVGELPSARVTGRCLLNDLEALSERFILVLDDYHNIRNAAVHDFLTELLIHPSFAMHLVLVTRRDPPLPLASLHARGILTEISSENLRFNISETKSLLERVLRISVTDKTIAVLEEKLEGWVTGLHLAAMSIRSGPDQERLVAGLQGPMKYVQNYLITEVLNNQLPAIRHYLLSTSILDRFCAALCHVLSGPDSEPGEGEIDGDEYIARLQKDNCFLIALDTENRWFRHHPLFQQLLKNQLNRHRSDEEIAALHFRASEWFESQHLIEEAIHHALEAGDQIRAAEICERHRHAAMNQEWWYVVQRWLAMLPAEIKQQRPELLLAQLFILTDQYRLLEMPPIIERVESLLADKTADDALVGELDFHRGLLMLFLQGDGEGARKRLEKARKRIPQTHGLMDSRLELYLAVARHVTGDGELALKSLEEKIRAADLEGDVYLSRLFAAQIYIHQLGGNLGAVVRVAKRLRTVSKRSGLAYAESWSHYLQANAEFQSYHLDEALQGFLLATEMRNILNRKAAVDALAGLVLTYQALQRTDDAVGALEQLRGFARETPDPGIGAVAESCQARLALWHGDLKLAMDWVRSYQAEFHAPTMLYWLEIPAMTQARIQIASGTEEDLAQALETLGAVRQQVEALHFTCQTIEILVLQAVALEKQGRAAEALAVLQQAIELAGPSGWIRSFVELGPPMADLLKRLQKQKVAVDYIEKLLAAIRDDEHRPVPGPNSLLIPPSRRGVGPAPMGRRPNSPRHPISPSTTSQPPVEPLTNRELQILDLLGQWLQNKEIAAKLFISPQTVKKHLDNIYGKLSVSSRRQAVEKAQILGILPRR